jgi:hypothetical protein
MWRSRRIRFALLGVLAVAVPLWFWLSRDEPAPPMVPKLEARSETKPLAKDKRVLTDEERAALLRRAHVWGEPEIPISQARFDELNVDELSCRFEVSDVGGTTPKFDCELPGGEEIRVKYGNGPEIPAEAAATRLLRTLGFGADHITLVATLRCYGCPAEPFSTLKAVEVTRVEGLFERTVNYDEYREFDWVAVERKFAARPIETDRVEGWSFFELDLIDASEGGAPRAHVDALRLMAVLLAHWDNKSENQRLVCLAREWPEDAPCPRPFLLLQDVGATFGPVKLDLAAWEQTRVWEDRARCTVSMRQLPFEGATFGSATIREEGRRFLADRLAQLSEDQLRELFESARFGRKRGLFNPSGGVDDWVRVFRDKARAVSEGPPCPTG